MANYTVEDFYNTRHLSYADAVQEIELQREQNERLTQAQIESDAYRQYLNGDDYWDHQNNVR